MAAWDKGSKWKKSFRKKVAQRFGYESWEKVKCCKCQRLANVKMGRLIDMHHVYSTAEYPELRLEVLNIVPLCNQCHTNFHRKYNIRFGRWTAKVGTYEDLVKFLGPKSSERALLR